ncbi:Uncharacterised protein [uncultured archaeon]|nr:Uncharacterised protein [uncultured archaeon]
MNNKSLRSIPVFLILFSILVMMVLPAMAEEIGIKISIKPSSTIANSTDDAYSATMDPKSVPGGGFYFLKVTIPAGYEYILPASGKTVGTYTMFNKTAHSNQVIIKIISNDTTAETVDVKYSTDYGVTYSIIKNQSIYNMVFGASTLKLTEPTPTTPGYLNISLGGNAGPILEQNEVTLIMAEGTLRNPADPGKYTWYLEAKSSPTGTPYTGHDDVRIIKNGKSHAKHFDVFDVHHPVDASLTLPSGSLTVGITAPPGVGATDFAVSLRNFDEDPIPDEKKGAESLSRFMFIGVDAPALRGISFTARINVSYASVLSSLTIPEKNLRLYRFNDSSSEWEPTLNGGVDTVNKIVYGDVTGFSTFGVLGAVETPPATSGAGSSTGGGGVISAEPYENILKSESYEKDFIANTPVTYKFSATEHGIYEIAVAGSENENDIAVRIEALKGTSKLAAASAPGTVYKNVNILAGTKKIKEAFIRFKVENSWLDSNNLAVSDVKMVKWDGSKWNPIETTELSKDASYTYFEAKTDSFSIWAIAGLKNEVSAAEPSVTQPEATPAVTTPAVTQTPSAGAPPVNLATIMVVIVLIAIVAVVYFKRKEIFKK